MYESSHVLIIKKQCSVKIKPTSACRVLLLLKYNSATSFITSLHSCRCNQKHHQSGDEDGEGASRMETAN